MRYCFEAVTTNAAKIMGLEGYGLEVGCDGDLVVLQAADPIEAIRLRARRLFVVRRGKVIAESARAVTRIDLPGRPSEVDPAGYAPRAANS
jgi:cytosine deaminase